MTAFFVGLNFEKCRIEFRGNTILGKALLDNNSEELHATVKDLHEKWNEVKDSISETDKIELAKEINNRLAVNDDTVSADKELDDTIDWDCPADITSASDVADNGLLESVGDFMNDILS